MRCSVYRKYIKRLLDIVLSLLALIILSPVMAIIAVLIRVKIGRPILFVQERPGKDETIFKLYKFRTMTYNVDCEGKVLSDNERLTNLGRILRKTSLDELPELWNILIGDMSIIGPRPLLVSYLPYYNPSERARHSIRPGLTGLAQVQGRNSLPWDLRLKADVEYTTRISLPLDFVIFCKTVALMLHIGKGVADDTEATEGNFAQIRQAELPQKEVAQR